MIRYRPCPWIRGGGGAAGGGNGLDGIISGWMKGGWRDGWKEGKKGGAGYSRDLSKGDRMRETRRKKGGHCLSSFFLSKASVTAAGACILLPFS